MIRHIAYVGPKDCKRIQDDSKRWHEFPQGVTLDAVELGFSEDRIKFMLKSGVFQLREGVVTTVPLEEPAKPIPEKQSPSPAVCSKCGFVAKSKSGLLLHQRWCKA